MKTSLAIILSAAVSSEAALVQFDLSPTGTSPGVGLSPSNEVPAVTNSSGSGDEISGGIVFDTASSTLSFAIGYGSAAGFTDLTGVPTAMHVHGPAGVGTNAPILFALDPFSFPAANPTNGGIVFGSVIYPTNAVADLLAGLHYVNIHTATNPTGEIRGQLIPVVVSNAPPSVSCPPATTNQCGTASATTVVVSDPDGDALTVVWSVNGAPMQTNSLPASNPPAAATNVSFSASLPLGTNRVAATVTDNATNSASCSTLITVVDTIPPVISSVTADRTSLWPPNHKYVEVRFFAHVTDTCGSATWKIISVQSNEPEDGVGDGHTVTDWIITGDHTVKLRAERSGKGSGRVYTITVRAADAAGNLSETRTTTVSVPHSRGKGKG